MKKLISFLAIPLIVSCLQKPKTMVPPCDEFSFECEKKKDFVLLSPIEFNKSCLDAHRRPLKKGKWYIIEPRNLANWTTLILVDNTQTEFIGPDHSKLYDIIGTSVKDNEVKLETIFFRKSAVSKCVVCLTGTHSAQVQKSNGIGLILSNKY